MNKILSTIAIVGALASTPALAGGKHHHGQGHIQDQIDYLHAVDQYIIDGVNYAYAELTGTDEWLDKRLRGLNKRSKDGDAALQESLSKTISHFDSVTSIMDQELHGVASQAAAMSTLPQPYGVGNSMLSVGVGHYGNAESIAVGFSHRCTEALVVKLNGAYTDDKETSEMLSIGLGYEW